MQVEQWGPPEASGAITFDDLSMERSKSFVKALQELKNLRPQLYSAAEYCEKSYLHNEQKEMVLDNLKDYAVRALVNAVDHLGTVAYKLNDLFEQQMADVSNVDLKVSCLSQKIQTCQTYADKEGLRQQRLLATAPRHHKHYVLPNSMSKNVPAGSQLHADTLAKPRPHSQGVPASKTLLWHLSSESSSTANESPKASSEQASALPFSNGDSITRKTTPEVFHLLDAVESTKPSSLSGHSQSKNRNPESVEMLRSFGTKDYLEVPKALTVFKPYDHPKGREICRPAARNKSLLSAFFAKSKYTKQKRAYAL